MAVVKVIEVLSNSSESWEDAAQNAVTLASKSVRNIRSINIQNMSATVGEDGKISEYRINAKLSFLLDD